MSRYSKAQPDDRPPPSIDTPIPGWVPKRHGHDTTPHEPSKESRLLVETLTGFGIIQTEIADILDIHPETLRKHYREQLALGAHRANAAVVNNLFQMATDPRGGSAAVNAAIWWTKSRMNWSETRKEAISADIRTVNANVRDMTDEQLLEIINRGRERRGASGEEVEPGKLQ